MNLILLIFMITAIFTILLFLVALRIKIVFDSDKSDINMTLLWLNSVFKALVTIEDAKPILTLYLFNKKILKRTFEKGQNKPRGMELVKLTNPKDVHVNAYYGFRDPFTTGIACGAVNIASQFINIDSINHIPDFLTVNDYIYLDATAKVNLGSILIKLYKPRSNN